MYGRLKCTALALGITVSVFSAGGSAAQAPAGPAKAHRDKAAALSGAAGQEQASHSAAEDKGSGSKEIPGEASGPVQQSETPLINSPVSDSELGSYIENALKRDPTLSGANLRVVVSEGGIELSGNVANAKDKLAAARLAQSFAGNKKLRNQITIGSPVTTQTPDGSRTSPKKDLENRRAAPSLSAQPKEAVPPLR